MTAFLLYGLIGYIAGATTTHLMVKYRRGLYSNLPTIIHIDR